MKKILKYSFSILFVLICAVSVLDQKGTVMPSAVRIGTDLGFIGVSLFDPDKRAFEINAEVHLYEFFITADYGMASWEFSRENFAYENSGTKKFKAKEFDDLKSSTFVFGTLMSSYISTMITLWTR